MSGQGLKKTMVRQFARPTGLLGELAGLIMAHRPSNRLRNAWAVEQLNIRPGDRVLEIGCGPGLAVREMSARLETGQVVGIDHSDTMLSQARRRNRRALADGRVELSQASVEDLVAGTSSISGSFDRILAVNVAMFWNDLDASIQGLASLLNDGGTLAIMHQPRVSPATTDAARQSAERFEHSMARASLRSIETRELTTLSPIAVCVLGTRDPSDSREHEPEKKPQQEKETHHEHS